MQVSSVKGDRPLSIHSPRPIQKDKGDRPLDP